MNKKVIIIIVVVTILAISVSAYFYFKKPKEAVKEDAKTKEADPNVTTKVDPISTRKTAMDYMYQKHKIDPRTMLKATASDEFVINRANGFLFGKSEFASNGIKYNTETGKKIV